MNIAYAHILYTYLMNIAYAHILYTYLMNITYAHCTYLINLLSIQITVDVISFVLLEIYSILNCANFLKKKTRGFLL